MGEGPKANPLSPGVGRSFERQSIVKRNLGASETLSAIVKQVHL